MNWEWNEVLKMVVGFSEHRGQQSFANGDGGDLSHRLTHAHVFGRNLEEQEHGRIVGLNRL